MKKMLVIGLMAFAFSSCQSEPANQQNEMMATPNGVPSASGQQAPAEQTAAGQKPATNPAHGQPFHDCSMAVGAPFASTAPAAH